VVFETATTLSQFTVILTVCGADAGEVLRSLEQKTAASVAGTSRAVLKFERGFMAVSLPESNGGSFAAPSLVDEIAYVPFPDNEAVSGPPPPPSTSRVDFSVPFRDGVKVTVMVQLEFPGRLVPQLLVWAKSAACVPVILTAETGRATGDTLVSVTS